MVAIHIFEVQVHGTTWQFVDVDFESIASAEELAAAVQAAVGCFVPTKVALFRYFRGLPKFESEVNISMEVLTQRLEALISLLASESMAVGVLAPDGYSIVFSRSDALKAGDTVEVSL